MITISFYRFIATNQVAKLKKDHKFHNVFKVCLDHEVCTIDSQLPVYKALSIVKHWLKDHYGLCIVHVDNQDEYDRGYSFKVCNHKKFISDMHKLHLEVTVRGFKI